MQEIVCEVCGRKTSVAPGMTTVCPSCGAPLPTPAAVSPKPLDEDDSATRPIIPPAANDQVAAGPASFVSDSSPSGAPGTSSATSITDETTRPVIPADAAHSVEDADKTRPSDVTADFPMPVPPERTQTLPPPAMPDTESQTRPALPIQPDANPAEQASVPTAGVGASSAESPHTNRPFALIPVLLLILLLLVVGAAGILLANGKLPFFAASPTPTAAATETPVPTPTAPSDLRVFTDADQVYSIGYPTSWLVATQNAPDAQARLVIFSNPLANANFEIGTLASTDTPAQQVDNQTLTLLAGKTKITNRSGPTAVFLAGQTWTQESGDVSVLIKGQPVQMHATALAIIHGNHTVYILQTAPVDTFPTLAPLFQEMLQSFQFLQ